MISSAESFFTEAQKQIPHINAFAETHELRGKAVADHLCYKCESREVFERIRAFLETKSAFVYQSMISERRIAIIKFKTSISTTLGNIQFLELSDQKPNGSQTNRFDHVEIYPTQGTYEELVSCLEERGIVLKKVERPHHTTHDHVLENGFIIRLEPDEPLIQKIIRDEMGV